MLVISWIENGKDTVQLSVMGWGVRASWLWCLMQVI